MTEGCVKVDGVDVREMSQKDLRDRLGYVPQKGVLFSGTIDSNIRYGKTDISDSEVEKAAKIAQAAEFIEEKPKGYQAPVAQGGTNVSGGQKQRLSIARAIAKKPEILIFDDSFSALDFKTDRTLREALKENTKDTTTIIVAQRISTILNADQILVLDDGRMAGLGTHRELMKNVRFTGRSQCRSYQRRNWPMSEQRRMPGGRMGHGGRGMGPGEKARDFRGAMAKLFRYMGRYKFRFILMFVFAVAGTVFNIVGPKVLGKATTELFNGLVAKVNGTEELIFIRSE